MKRTTGVDAGAPDVTDADVGDSDGGAASWTVVVVLVGVVADDEDGVDPSPQAARTGRIVTTTTATPRRLADGLSQHRATFTLPSSS